MHELITPLVLSAAALILLIGFSGLVIDLIVGIQIAAEKKKLSDPSAPGSYAAFAAGQAESRDQHRAGAGTEII
jgi:hypothetical protein